MVGEERRFHGLPPLKRFKMLEKERVKQATTSKVTEVRREEEFLQKNDCPSQQAGVQVLCCLPAKKRVCALQFFAHEDEEQENKTTMPLLTKKASPVLLARPLQPVHLNRPLPTSVTTIQSVSSERMTVTKKKKKEEGEETRPEFRKSAEIHVAKEHVQNQCLPMIAEGKSSTGVQLSKKKGVSSALSKTLQHVQDQQISVDPAIVPSLAVRKSESKLIRRRGELDPNATDPESSKSRMLEAAGGVCAQINLQTFSTERSINASTGMSVATAKPLDRTEANSITKSLALNGPKASRAANQIDRGAMTFGLEVKSTDLKKEEEPNDEDDGVFCDVCKEADAEPSDPIVFCDGCNVMVHASCYGSPLIDGIPEDDWFCRQCESEKKSKKVDQSSRGGHARFRLRKHISASRVCCLCPSRKGAMKQTTGGAWAHLSCALYVPEVFYRRARDREEIECGSVPTWRWELPCVVCSTQGQGSCIQCTEVGCCSTFHVSCALDAGLTIDYRNANALTKTPAIVIAFCPSHSRQSLTCSERRRFKIVPRC